MRWLVIAIAACGGGPRYLGAQLPDACAGADAEACAGWMAERDLDAGNLDVYPDAALRRYVQSIADRLARGTGLAHPPRVVISDHDGTYAAFGDRIVIGRIAIEKLGSEAELAAIVAHELVHVEGRHATVSLFGPEADERWLATRRDAEAIADERAVMLLERAGYAPAAMQHALEAELDPDDDASDDEHPPRALRLAHVEQLAGGRIDGFDGRRELLDHVRGMVLGRDTRLGVRVGGGDAWVIARLGVALELSPRDVVHVDGDAVVVRHAKSSLTAYAVGAPWARELAATLDERADTETPMGRVTVGTAPDATRSEAPLARLEQSLHDLLPQPAPGAWVVILDRPCGGLVLELSPRTDPAIRDRWLQGLRAATAGELAAAEPRHLRVVRAPRAGTVAELVQECPDPDAAAKLDRADRVLGAGDPIKCTDR